MRVARSCVLSMLAALMMVTAGFAGCRSPSTDCTCLVENGGDKRTLACGETSCVGGTSIACVDKESIVTQGICSAAPPPSASPASEIDSGAPPDPSCPNLLAFCGTSCTSPASVATSCQSVASAGDPQACASWQAGNAILCNQLQR